MKVHKKIKGFPKGFPPNSLRSATDLGTPFGNTFAVT